MAGMNPGIGYVTASEVLHGNDVKLHPVPGLSSFKVTEHWG